MPSVVAYSEDLDRFLGLINFLLIFFLFNLVFNPAIVNLLLLFYNCTPIAFTTYRFEIVPHENRVIFERE